MKTVVLQFYVKALTQNTTNYLWHDCGKYLGSRIVRAASTTSHMKEPNIRAEPTVLAVDQIYCLMPVDEYTPEMAILCTNIDCNQYQFFSHKFSNFVTQGLREI